MTQQLAERVRPVCREDRLAASVCLDSFEHFVREFWDEVPGAGTCIWNWHLSLFCDELQALAGRVERGEPRLYDLVANVPFGASKSTVFSILFPAWCWARAPWMRFICASHTDGLVMDLADKSKSVVESDKYRRYFPHVKIRKDRSARDDFATTAGGERKSCTVGGKTPTGRHAHILIVDDPLDPQGARSEADLENANKFMTEVIPSRKTDKAVSVTVLVMQRLHHRDPTAELARVAALEGAYPVRRICLPGELDASDDDVFPPLAELRSRYGPRVYAEDGLLDPRRLPRAVLEDYKVRLGSYSYAGQVLQKPTPPGGGMFKSHYFSNRVKAAPYHSKRIRYWDRAATQGAGCYTAGVLLARSADGRYYVEHVVHGQWEPTERNRRILATAQRDRLRYGPSHDPVIYVEMERGSTGLESFQSLARLLAGFNVREDRPVGSKDVRAEPWSSMLASGNVFLVEDGSWDINGYVEEHALFRPEPGKRLGGLKDQVDASSAAFNLLSGAKTAEGLFRAVSMPDRRTVVKAGGPGLRVIACGHAALGELFVEQPCLLVGAGDPGAAPDWSRHGLSELVDTLALEFADVDPAEVQEAWDAPLEPYGKLPEEVIMQRGHGKALWAALLRRRPINPLVLVFADQGDRRALSLATAVSQALRLPAGTLIDQSACPGALNAHVVALAKNTRSLVVG